VQKDFVSDAGHELRTPITIIRGHLELLGDDPGEAARRSRFVDDLLLLAQAEQADFIQLGDVDLDALTDELLAKAGALAPREWHLQANGIGRCRPIASG
jgi:signal transduction histidine kinase